MASTNKAGTNAAPNVKKNQEHAQKHNFNLSHGKDLPTYMKWGKRDQMTNMFVGGVCLTGVALSFRGFYNMAWGINKS